MGTVWFSAVFSWIALSFAVGIWSRNKGGSFAAGLVYALAFSPLVAGAIVAVRKPISSEIEKRAVASGQMRRCPFCAEMIKTEAIKCRFCGSMLSSASTDGAAMQEAVERPAVIAPVGAAQPPTGAKGALAQPARVRPELLVAMWASVVLAFFCLWATPVPLIPVLMLAAVPIYVALRGGRTDRIQAWIAVCLEVVGLFVGQMTRLGFM